MNPKTPEYQIEFNPEALDDLTWFRKVLRTRIVKALKEQLRHQPTTETRNRKRLRINRLSEWELRIDDVRVFYEVIVDNALVVIVAIGYKRRDKLFFRGQEYQL